MPVEFSCDGCNRRLRAPDAKAGKRTNCPTCGKELQIPVMSAGPQISLPSAGEPIPGPLDHLAASIPSASEAAEFNLSKPRTTPKPINLDPPTPSAASASPAAAIFESIARKPAPQIDIGLADEPTQKPAGAPTVNHPGANSPAAGSGSSSGIGGALKPKPNAWRGGEKTPQMPAPVPKPAAPRLPTPNLAPHAPQPSLNQPSAPILDIPSAAFANPASAAPQSPLVPVSPLGPVARVAPNPLEDMFKDLPQLAPVSAPSNFGAQPYSNAPMFGGLRPVTAADPFQSQGAALPTTPAPRWDQIASTANVGSGNPYAAPSMGASSGYGRRVDIESVRTMVVIPGVFLLITYILLTIIYAFQMCLMAIAAFAVTSSNQGDSAERGIVFAQGAAAVFCFALAVIGLFGSIKMIRVRSRGSALAAAIMAIFPFYICLPLGIWAVIVLSMENVRMAFEANDRRAERGR